MTESEQIARWLDPEQKVLKYWHNDYGFHLQDSNYSWDPPDVDFRTSNEWAGAVLEKLKDHFVHLEWSAAGNRWCCILLADGKYVITENDTWRSAVVQAALEVIRRSARHE